MSKRALPAIAASAPTWWNAATKTGATNRANPAETERTWYRINNAGGTSTADIHLYDEIGMWGITAADFVRDLGTVKASTLNVHVNSPGGDVFDGVAIYNALRNYPGTVDVTVDGIAASAASFIAMAGDSVTMQRGTRMMIHDAQGAAAGDCATMRECADLLDSISEMIASLYAARAGGQPSAWRDAMKATTFYSPAEAVAARLADTADDAEPATADPAALKPTAVADVAITAAIEATPAGTLNDMVDEPLMAKLDDTLDTVLDDTLDAPWFDSFDPADLRASLLAAIDEPIAFDADIFRAAVNVAANDVALPRSIVETAPIKALAPVAVATPAASLPAPAGEPIEPAEPPLFDPDILRAAITLAANDVAAPRITRTTRADPLPEVPEFTVNPDDFRRALREAKL